MQLAAAARAGVAVGGGRRGGGCSSRVVVVAWLVVWGVVCCGRGAAAAAGVEQQQQQSQPQSQQRGAASQQLPACRGLHRAVVDWWVMLKHPRGYHYSYVDSSSSSTSSGCASGLCWRHGLSMLNPNPASHTLELLGAATAAAASGDDSLAHVIYNDADPGGTEHFEAAHAKGVVAFSGVPAGSNISSSSAAGFWFVHSAPRFPGVPAAGSAWMQLQRPQSVFGQHFSCFSLSGNSSIAAVAEALLAAGPYVYSSRLPTSLAAAYPRWAQLLAGGFERRPVAVAANLTRAGSQDVLLAFAKTSSLNVSLTDAVVGPGLGVDMFWETWRRSHDALPSACPSSSTQHSTAPGHPAHSSLNVDSVAFPGTQLGWAWEQDHSKWGVSSSASANSSSFVCLGDMNRAAWQARRGGSYVCLQHRGLWQAFHSLLAAAEPCRWQGAVA